MSLEGHYCGPDCPECGYDHGCICGNDCLNPDNALGDQLHLDHIAEKLRDSMGKSWPNLYGITRDDIAFLLQKAHTKEEL